MILIISSLKMTNDNKQAEKNEKDEIAVIIYLLWEKSLMRIHIESISLPAIPAERRKSETGQK
jgi:hypothetical protein